jgi:hypothetical protein
VLALLLLVAGVVGVYFWIQSRKVPIEAGVVPQKVRITNVADNKFSVSWVTTSNTSGSVEYGKTGEKLTQAAKDDRDSGSTAGSYTTHHVTIDSLQPNTAYSFRILSGSRKTSFDNSGTPYSATTGPVIAGTPPAKSFYGTVQPGTAGSAEGALVYIALPGSAPASTLVKGSGTYTVSLPTMRTADLKSYVTYDPSATIVTMTLESGKAQSTVSVSTANMAPVPTITLGKDADFRNVLETPAVAEVTTTPVPSSSSAETPTIFNVEPLAEESINAVTNTSLSILNPAAEGETLATLRPEFRGTAPASTTLTIALTGQKAVSDTLTVGSDGTWSWAPVIDLKTGKQTITVSYLATGGTTQKLSRGFTISTTKVTSDPAFVSSPSASTSTKTSTASATPRAVMPATESGVPTTGVLTPTLLTGIIGVVIMILGATLLAL